MEILRQQKETVEQRQRQLLLKQMRDQEYETNVLQSIKQEWFDAFWSLLFRSSRCCYILVFLLIVANIIVVMWRFEKIWKAIGSMPPTPNNNVTKTNVCICPRPRAFSFTSNVTNTTDVPNVNAISRIEVPQTSGRIHDIFPARMWWSENVDANRRTPGYTRDEETLLLRCMYFFSFLALTEKSQKKK